MTAVLGGIHKGAGTPTVTTRKVAIEEVRAEIHRIRTNADRLWRITRSTLESINPLSLADRRFGSSLSTAADLILSGKMFLGKALGELGEAMPYKAGESQPMNDRVTEPLNPLNCTPESMEHLREKITHDLIRPTRPSGGVYLEAVLLSEANSVAGLFIQEAFIRFTEARMWVGMTLAKDEEKA